MVGRCKTCSFVQKSGFFYQPDKIRSIQRSHNHLCAQNIITLRTKFNAALTKYFQSKGSLNSPAIIRTMCVQYALKYQICQNSTTLVYHWSRINFRSILYSSQVTSMKPEENQFIRLSMAVREKRYPKFGAYSQQVLVKKHNINFDKFRKCENMLFITIQK